MSFGDTLSALGLATESAADVRTLSEIEDVIRTMPPYATVHHGTQDNFQWLGRAAAALTMWDRVRSAGVHLTIGRLGAASARENDLAYRALSVLLHQAQSELRLQTIGPVNVAVGQGQVFQYFDQVRQVIAEAMSDILFVDPYMEAEFVARYLPHVKSGVAIRLLGRERMPQLVSAVGMFTKEHGARIEVRSSASLHDRYVFVDSARCFQSGASFKDGGLKAGTTLTENTDAFAALQGCYEGLWKSGALQKLGT